jgi:hypothetical protein
MKERSNAGLASVANGLRFDTQSCIVYAGDCGSALKTRAAADRGVGRAGVDDGRV